MVKNLSANAQDAGDEASTLGSGRSRGEGNSKPTPDFLPGKIPWTEEPGRLVYGVAESQTRLGTKALHVGTKHCVYIDSLNLYKTLI